jgi:uncharacterized protein YndB with AHSA1/START domain
MMDNSIMADLDDRELVITRIFDAPRELVFQAWTDPQRMLQWMGPRSHPARLMEMDARPGGAWRGCLDAADGSGELWQSGTCWEIVPPERVVFTFAWHTADGTRGAEQLVTIVFAAVGDKTRMTFRQSPFQTVESRDGHVLGWHSAFDRFDDYLARTAAGAAR